MNIIFDEYKYAESIIKNGFSKYLNFKDLLILSKYYRYLGYDDFRMRDEIKQLCIDSFSQFNEVRSGDKLDNAIKCSNDNSIRFFSSIKISKKELDIIKTANNYKQEKILFIMLVLNKHHENGKICENHYVNYSFSDIFKLAKVYVNSKEKYELLFDLVNKGFIRVPNVDARHCYGNNNLQLFYRNDDLDFLEVNEEDNLISFYPFYCSKCGKMVEKRKGRQKICQDCWRAYDRDRKH
jgi:hypothetical protein